MSKVYTVSSGQIRTRLAQALAKTPYRSWSELRKSIREGYDCSCANCYEYSHPYARQWRLFVMWSDDWKKQSA